jgi:hypothetical protein
MATDPLREIAEQLTDRESLERWCVLNGGIAADDLDADDVCDYALMQLERAMRLRDQAWRQLANPEFVHANEISESALNACMRELLKAEAKK